MSTRSSKRQKTDSSSSPPYELIYWPGIPGRGEHIRLLFEASGTPYTDVSNAAGTASAVLSQISTKNNGDDLNPPPLAPPVLKHGDLLISQTPNVLLYLGQKLGLAPALSDDEDGYGYYHVNALALTALDGLGNEAHDTHHPIASAAYYEDQKDAALAKAKDYRTVRLPKFLEYFERVLGSPASKGGEWLYGGKMSYADLVLWQCLDGVKHAFPRCVEKMQGEGKYERVWELYERVKGVEGVNGYLGSERRMGYGMGIWRYYEELDE